MGSLVASVVGTVAGAVFGSKSSSKAADAAVEGQDAALAATQAAAAQAREDVIPLFGQGKEDRRLATSAALKFLQDAIPKQIQPFQSGNVAAQEQLLRGLPQIQNAILGNKVDLSGFRPREIPFEGFNLPATSATVNQPATQPVVGGVEVPNNLIGLDRTGFDFQTFLQQLGRIP